jgi:hypothetical protein
MTYCDVSMTMRFLATILFLESRIKLPNFRMIIISDSQLGFINDRVRSGLWSFLPKPFKEQQFFIFVLVLSGLFLGTFFEE